MKDRRRTTAAIALEIGLRRLEREYAQQEEPELEADVSDLVDDHALQPVALH